MKKIKIKLNNNQYVIEVSQPYYNDCLKTYVFDIKVFFSENFLISDTLLLEKKEDQNIELKIKNFLTYFLKVKQ